MSGNVGFNTNTNINVNGDVTGLFNTHPTIWTWAFIGLGAFVIVFIAIVYRKKTFDGIEQKILEKTNAIKNDTNNILNNLNDKTDERKK